MAFSPPAGIRPVCKIMSPQFDSILYYVDIYRWKKKLGTKICAGETLTKISSKWTHHLKSSYPILFSSMGIPKKDYDAGWRGHIFAYRSNTSWTITWQVARTIWHQAIGTSPYPHPSSITTYHHAKNGVHLHVSLWLTQLDFTNKTFLSNMLVWWI